jgi:predicted nuclease with TOPRIM domain
MYCGPNIVVQFALDVEELNRCIAKFAVGGQYELTRMWLES